MGNERSEDRVLETLAKLSQGDNHVTTTVLARELKLSRSVTSHYLSSLLKAGKVVKSDGRPVQWQSAQRAATRQQRLDLKGLAAVIGATGSQKESIQKCIAAVNYPGGLNLLITGKSGVGKTFLARRVYEYARDTGVVPTSAPYKVLNCADYANNPELLSSILFGYTKGAFTGAVTSKSGLIQEADGGYLFLDEVHRLSGENQEKLFTFMDTGKYRPIGENQRDYHAKVRFIFATTENPQATMLETFNRRVPVTVRITPYEQRPINERLEFIRTLFLSEAKRFKTEITVTADAVQYLLNLKLPGNIGKLNNMIKVACAKVFSYHAESAGLTITQTDFDNSQLAATHIGENTGFQDLKISVDDAPVVEQVTNYGELISKQLLNKPILKSADVRECLQNIERSLITQFKADSVLHRIHQQWFKKIIIEKFGLTAATDYEPLMFQLYRQRVVLTGEATKLLERLLASQPRSEHVAKYFYQRVPLLDANSKKSLIILLSCVISELIDETIPLRCLMVAHGSQMATSIQSVVNQLCGTYLVDAIDMPIDSSIEQIISLAKATIEDFDTSSGFILLIDMGSLSQLYRQVKGQLNGDVLVINNLTTAIGLDIGLKLQQKLPFEQIAEHASTEYTISTQYFEGFAQNANIVISCMSGLGISEKLKDIFQGILGEKLSVVTRDFHSLRHSVKSNDIQSFKSTLLVITTTNLPDSFAIPHINIYDLLDITGQKMLNGVLNQYTDQKEFDKLYNLLVRFLSIEGVTERLSFLNPDVIIQEVETVIFKFENYYHIKIDGKIKLNLYMHISLMVERLMTRVSDPEANSLGTKSSSAEQEFNQVAKGILKPIELKYNIVVNSYELSLLYELFKYILDEQ